MAAPVVSPIVSAQVATVGEPYRFQPAASGLEPAAHVQRADATDDDGIYTYLVAPAVDRQLVFLAAPISQNHPSHYSAPSLSGLTADVPYVISAINGNQGLQEIQIKTTTGDLVSDDIPSDRVHLVSYVRWEISNLPDGLSYDYATGEISGTPTEIGVSDVVLIARNADGDSAEVIFPLGVAGAPYSTGAGSSATVGMVLDWNTELVTGPGAGGRDLFSIDRQLQAIDSGALAGTAEAQLVMQTGSEKAIALRIDVDGTPRKLSVSGVELVIQAGRSGQLITLTDGSFEPRGDGEEARVEFLLTCPEADDLPTHFFGDGDINIGTNALAQLSVDTLRDGGGSSLVEETFKSQIFYLRIEKGLK